MQILSRRVGLYKEDGRKNRDEIAYLAQTFDEMLEELEKVFQRENNLHLMCHMSCEHLSALFWHSVSRVWKKKALTKNSGNRLWSYRKRRGQSQS